MFYTENLNAHRRYIAMRGGGALPLAIVRGSLHFLIRSSLFLFPFFFFLTFTVSHRENLIEQWLTNLAIYASIYYYITRNIAPFSFYTLLVTFVHLCNRWTYLEKSSSEIPFTIVSLYCCMHQYGEWLLLHDNAFLTPQWLSLHFWFANRLLPSTIGFLFRTYV